MKEVMKGIGQVWEMAKRLAYRLTHPHVGDLSYDEYLGRKRGLPHDIRFDNVKGKSWGYVIRRDGSLRKPNEITRIFIGTTAWYRQLCIGEIVAMWKASSDPDFEGSYELRFYDEKGQAKCITSCMHIIDCAEAYDACSKCGASRAQINRLDKLHREMLSFPGQYERGGWLGLLVRGQEAFRKCNADYEEYS